VTESWFEKLTGFHEETPEQVRANFIVGGSTLTSRVNSREMRFGRLETPSLAELRKNALGSVSSSTGLSVEEIVCDVKLLHALPEANGALFQVASQFNLLEMVSPSVTPEAGVSIYEKDLTQGPACAIAAGAGTIYRNYFAPVGGRLGQSADCQINCLAELGRLLGNEGDCFWTMRNGYVIATDSGLREISRRIGELDQDRLDEIRGALRIGLQWDTEVTLDDCGHLVTQALCSALPVAYSPYAPQMWEPFARLILEAAYEATLAAASINQAKTGNAKVFLTQVGGGAFGNRVEWIISAVKRALRLFEKYPLDVKIVSYGYSDPRICELL